MVVQIVESSDYQMISPGIYYTYSTTQIDTHPDVICLAGRVYKDKFISSNYENKEAIEKAIEW